jgi:2-succinyl-5-enolpyruvyl-6-hydroxy-3-cyclohexene-1-carboxylate synthase
VSDREDLVSETRMPAATLVADPAGVYAFIGRFFRSLMAAGVEHVVISPGSRSTPLAVSARQIEGLRIWVELDERAAAFFALGLAKESGRPAVLVCTSGTAAANYLPAIIEAHYSRIPMIVATADRPPELRDWGAGQTIEQVGLYGNYPRWSVEVPVPQGGLDAGRYASQLAARAVETATASPAGVVHLNWPLREPLAPPEGALEEIRAESGVERSGSSFGHGQLSADPEDVRMLAALARRYERGVLCCGPMRMTPALRGAITAFSHQAGWPVLTDPTSDLRSEVDSRLGPLLDAGDVLTRSEDFAQKMRPDVVIRLGETPVSKAQRLWIEDSDPAEVIWLEEGGQWGEPSRLATRVIRGASCSLLSAAALELASCVTSRVEGAELDSAVSEFRNRSWCRSFEAKNHRARAAINEVVESEEEWSGVAVAATLARVAPPGALLFSSNSMSIRLLDLAMANRPEPLRVLCSRGASGIDGVTSTALGAAAGAGQPTFLLTGDLAFLHDLSGLLLARRETIPLTIVVLDDNGGGIFSFLPIAAQGEHVSFGELFQTPHDVELARVAELFQLDYSRVGNVGELESAIAQSSSSPGVSIVHVPVDAETNEARFRRAVAFACEAVDASIVQ